MLERVTRWSACRVGLVLLSLSMLSLPGCRLPGRRVQKEAPPAEFVSPIAPMGQPGMGLEEIRGALDERRARIRSVQAAMTLTVGAARSRGRQQFDASVYSRPATAEQPEVLRVRGSADAGPVFDFLLHRNEVQTVIYPERKYYRGTLQDLRRNPQLLAGVQPDDLAGAFLVERRLFQRIRENPETPVQETNDHYVLSFAIAPGILESFHLRKSDLLVDLVEQGDERAPTASIRYFGYRWDEKGGLVPTRYDALLANGAEVQVNVGDARFNEEAPEGITRVNVPEGYERMSL